MTDVDPTPPDPPICPLPVYVPDVGLHECGALVFAEVLSWGSLTDLDNAGYEWRIVCASGHRLLVPAVAGDQLMPNEWLPVVDEIRRAIVGTWPLRPTAVCDRCGEPISATNGPCLADHDPPRHQRCCGHAVPVLADHEAGRHLGAPLLTCPGCRGQW